MKETISEAQMKITLAVPIATCILVGILHGQSNEQATKPSGQLELRVAQTRVTKDQPFVLELRLRNTGTRPFYAVGNINYAVARLYGDYTIQLRTVGSDWKSLGNKIAGDPMPQAYYRPPTEAEFIQNNNIVLFEKGDFIGHRTDYTWEGTTLLPPGRYELRATYRAFEDGLMKAMMKTMRFPFLTGELLSNTVAVEIRDK
ncbi:MAG: hypothetical protein AUH86_25460 [Acidobacteria bacterium 13_1_40CM_4_58_4]|nr:MAG: hypothetical protein AUH86_25460 [Acidobacteria bacterium 13_1_40CM_4_58_4]